MLTLIRKHAQSWLIKVLLGLIIVTFVISFGVGQFANPKQVLVKIGSQEIMVRDFQQLYQRELDTLRRQFPENADEVATRQNLRKRVYDNMVDRILVRQAAADAGLLVGDGEVSDSITALEVFRQENEFDPDLYRRILQQNRRTPQGFEEETRTDLLVGKYQRNLIAGLVVGGAEVEQRYRLENQQLEAEFFHFDPKLYLKRSKSDPAAEKEYHQKHTREFMRPAQTRVSYFVLPLEKVEAGTKVRAKAVERHYKRFLEEKFTTPKEVRASHILRKLTEKPTAEQEAAARALLESILERLGNGADFAELAKKHSQDASKNRGGDLGFFKAEEIFSQISRAAFGLEKGGLSGVVRSPFGFHIIKVTDVKPAVVKTFAEVRAEIEKTLKALRAERRLELEAERLPGRIEAEGLAAVAAGWELDRETTDWFDASTTLPGLGRAAALYGQARTRRKGKAGVWRRNPIRGHVLFIVEEKRPEFLLPLDEVRAKVAEKVRVQRSEETALKEAREAIETITSPESFAKVAKDNGFAIKATRFSALARVVPEVGFNLQFQSTAWGLTGEKPYGLSVNGTTAHVIFLKRRFFPEPEKAAEAKKAIAARLENEWAQYFISREIDRLAAATGVEVVAPELVP